LARSAAKIELPPIALHVTVAQARSGYGEASRAVAHWSRGWGFAAVSWHDAPIV